MATPNFELEFKMDGRPLLSSEINRMEHVRAIHVLKAMRVLGADVRINAETATDEAIEALDHRNATATLVENKLKLGNDGILALYRDKIAESDATWREISAESTLHADMKPSIVEVTARGLKIPKFMAGVLKMADRKNPGIFYGTNPEHFASEPLGGTKSVAMETMGMHGEPVHAKFRTGFSGHEPIARDPDTRLTFFAKGALFSDGTDMKIVAMHQIKNHPEGLSLKLGIFFPSATPDELVEGHKWHLAVEFGHFLRVAAEAHVPIRTMLAHLVLPFLR